MPLTKQIKDIKEFFLSFIGALVLWFDKEEEGYYSINPLYPLTKSAKEIVIRVLSRFGLEFDKVRFSNRDDILTFPPSQYHVGNLIYKELRHYYLLKMMWRNRRRNLQRRKS